MFQSYEKKYSSKIFPVHEYILENLDRKISLNQLAFLSGFSNFHFHRIFKELQGEPIATHLKRLRLEKAAFELKISEIPLKEISIQAGFDSYEAFSRAFKKFFLLSPQEFRKRNAISQKQIHHFSNLPKGIKLNEIHIRKIDSVKLAFLRKLGPYEDLPGPDLNSKEFKMLLEFVKLNQMNPKNHLMIGVCQDDPEITKSNFVRFDIGFSITKKCKLLPEMGIQTLKGGNYLVCRYRGEYKGLTEIYNFLLYEYCPKYKYKITSDPLFEVYIYGFEKEIADIFIPLKK
ncbi:MAG TPA: AraC family transcriptional regulator [Leptospiraceae bacterium]|nr:AraC family transcriptional regulator [Leptospiraceae bacterium]HMW06082.1 AraC family transcriptional regulator [Leptospiraceae bacterium]HMX33370.1 AraC family transcriptional regulator [Leptospiraceae bacterium]HMY31376.1 AraC family transcriptional regulator [Leptospiraceae bacterium]HMZ65004.1 AraC family transcriptional regulator [Leptospiraceae bacterium]